MRGAPQAELPEEALAGEPDRDPPAEPELLDDDPELLPEALPAESPPPEVPDVPSLAPPELPSPVLAPSPAFCSVPDLPALAPLAARLSVL